MLSNEFTKVSFDILKNFEWFKGYIKYNPYDLIPGGERWNQENGLTYAISRLTQEGLDPNTDEAWQKVGIDGLNGLRTILQDIFPKRENSVGSYLAGSIEYSNPKNCYSPLVPLIADAFLINALPGVADKLEIPKDLGIKLINTDFVRSVCERNLHT